MHGFDFRWLFFGLLATLLFTSSPALASEPLSGDMIDRVRSGLDQCEGGWITFDYGERTDWGAKDLLPFVASLRKPSRDLDSQEGRLLYKIALGLLTPAIQRPDYAIDRSQLTNCPPMPNEAVAIMQYLVGTEPTDLRGYSNAFTWLAASAEQGIGSPQHTEMARRYLLRARMHSTAFQNARWQDEVDGSLIGNIERAGYRDYLERLASSQDAIGRGSARIILAEEALDDEPEVAVDLLMVLDVQALRRLFELEEEGLVTRRSDPVSIAFWKDAYDSLPSKTRWSQRLVDLATEINGGRIGTQDTGPSISSVAPLLDIEKIGAEYLTSRPIPVRALVGPNGDMFFAEPCRSTPLEQLPNWLRGDLMAHKDAARIYELAGLPRFDLAETVSLAPYRWILLPSIQVVSNRNGERVLSLSETQSEDCFYSSIREPVGIIIAG